MKILVGISGGVDSAAAARLLMNMGHEVEGAVLIMHEHTELSAAKEVAESLHIPLHEIDARDAFDKVVRTNFVSEYLAGRTPNPCIICNAEVKFKYLHDYAISHGFDKIATGHYAKVASYESCGETRYLVLAGEDTAKDQSYMLYRLSQEILSRLILPLAEYNKVEIRKIARDAELSVADRADSLEICFIPDNDYAAYIESVGGKSPDGDFVDGEGRVLGRHKGIIRYTVGQRKGLGISLGERAFVSKIDAAANTVTLSRGAYAVSRLLVSDIVYSGIKDQELGKTVRLSVRVRYKSKPVLASVSFIEGGMAEVLLDTSVSASPGQSAVFYDGNRVIAGGFITSVESFDGRF